MTTTIERLPGEPGLDEANAIIARLEALVAARVQDTITPARAREYDDADFDTVATLVTWFCVMMGSIAAITIYLLAPRWIATGAVIALVIASRIRPQHVATRVALGLVIGALISLWS